MNRLRLWVMLFVLAILSPGQAARANAKTVSFNLSTSKSFAPGEQPKIHLYTHNVDAVEICRGTLVARRSEFIDCRFSRLGARLPENLPVWLHGTDDVELSAERDCRRDAGQTETVDACG